MPTAASESRPPRRQPAETAALSPVPAMPAVSMRDLLASCAAATAVSTPPRDEQLPVRGEPRRDAA